MTGGHILQAADWQRRRVRAMAAPRPLAPGSSVAEIELLARMRHPLSGVDVRTRRYHLSRFPACFIGASAATCYRLDGG